MKKIKLADIVEASTQGSIEDYRAEINRPKEDAAAQLAIYALVQKRKGVLLGSADNFIGTRRSTC